MACGFAATYPQLVAGAHDWSASARRGACRPPMRSSRDYFPAGRRGTALGIFNLGPPIGLALGVAFGASIAAAYDWRSAFSRARPASGSSRRWPSAASCASRCAAASTCAPAAGASRGSVEGAVLADMPDVLLAIRSLLRASLASGATQIVTYGSGNFTTLFLMREKGMTLGRDRGLVCAGARPSDQRRDVRLRPADRPARAALEARLRHYPPRRWRSPSRSSSVSSRRRTGSSRWCSWRCPCSSTTSICRPPSRWCRKKCARMSACLPGALLLLVMNLIGLGLGPTCSARRATRPERKPSGRTRCSLRSTRSCLSTYSRCCCFLWLARALRREERADDRA